MTMWEFRPWAQFQLYNRTSGEKKQLANLESNLLLLLLSNPHRVVSKEEIHDEIWKGKVVSDASVTRAVASLRLALNDSAEAQSIIRTAPKVGYFIVSNEILLNPEHVLQVTQSEPVKQVSVLLLRSWRMWSIVILLILNAMLFCFLFLPVESEQRVALSRQVVQANSFVVERDDPLSLQLMDYLVNRTLPDNVDFYITSNATRIYVSCVRRATSLRQKESLNFSFDNAIPKESISDEIVQKCQ
ncbi:winged helix-turn-helix domain-containing protein [Vibrio sp. CAU 1672]|uniref:winged helix-turn-helix domain-containing protein n=1 Tax=Vibrio sp. CAU 1672 TaxID=3032594 RepID=UPI0023DC9E44|nr:winged helix-turn-helix domain-containing protein [Vibrio sp. CAU 1672]MDF2152821.1 winged helix-turn-helix domain-containing protein [Vibrio sp. CAU 1672]